MRRVSAFLAGLLLLTACAGQDVTQTPRLINGLPATDTSRPTSPMATPAPDCADPTRAQQAAIQFLERYNAGDVEAIMKMLAPDLRQYIDASSAFQATGANLPDIRGHLTQMFSAHDQLTAREVNAAVEPSRVLVEYSVRIPDVTRTNDTLKGRSGGTAKGPIEMGVRCDTLLLSIIAIETR